MTISNKNTRTTITIPKELKEKLENVAKEQNRSFNNLVITILKNSYARNTTITTSSTSDTNFIGYSCHSLIYDNIF